MGPVGFLLALVFFHVEVCLLKREKEREVAKSALSSLNTLKCVKFMLF